MAGCYWNDGYCLLSSTDLEKLPQEAVEILQHGSNVQYLDTLAELALDADWTAIIFARYQPLFVDFCGRYRQKAEKSPSTALRSILALSRILPYAKHLSTVVQEITLHQRFGVFGALGAAANPPAILEISSPNLIDILLIYLRLLEFDNHGFASLVSPVQLNVLLSHQILLIRYLACKAFCLLMNLPERVFIELTLRFVGKVEAAQPALEADWEGKTIDYRFLELWESKRLQNLHEYLYNPQLQAPVPDKSVTRTIRKSDLSPLALTFGGHLAIGSLDTQPEESSLVPTKTYLSNLQSVARAVCEAQAILVYGPSGSGKTTLIREVARTLNQHSHMLTLHLNEQTDAKLLIGIYTSSVETGLFKWQPGVLTTAVSEGRWILIEDLDRAPSEVVSMLLPLLDRQELMVPNMGGPVRAAPGFKLIATIRSDPALGTKESGPNSSMIGYRLWGKVELAAYSMTDLKLIVDGSFPLLRRYRPGFLQMFDQLTRYAQDANLRLMNERALGPHDLLRFCMRTSNLLESAGINDSGEPIPEAIQDDILLDAIDCFSSAVSDASAILSISQIIAQNLQMHEARVRFCMMQREPEYLLDPKGLRLGRAYLKRSKTTRNIRPSGKPGRNGPFASTPHTLRTMESIAAAVNAREPCLLVGETGIGKTFMLQELAQVLDQRLLVVNLSQQSEAGDLLGGFKPINLRSLAVPIKDDFDILFEKLSRSPENERFMKLVNRAYKSGNWKKLIKLWEMALEQIGTVTSKFKSNQEGHPSKRRKSEPAKHQKLKSRWNQFAIQIDMFRKHLQSGSKGFAFSFVESKLVKAVRNGDWVLLDEINLAAPDTLESLSDLLSTGPSETGSLLLAETGEMQRIRAHPDFRIFGAMNPATDIGKRNLPIGIRSRFTEIFVTSPEVDTDSLLKIVDTYLGSYSSQDVRLSNDVMKLYLDIRALETNNQLVDGANQKPHFTLRTLTRTLTYAVDVAPTYTIRRALFEGFSMSFLTALDPSSTSLVRELIWKRLFSKTRNPKALLSQIPRSPGASNDFRQFRHHWMRRGPLPIEEPQDYIITPFVDANLLNLVRATSTRRYPVLLQGPTSSGKTSMVEYLAKLSGNKFMRINNHEHTDLQEYLGTYISDHTGIHFQEGSLVRALKAGHWLVLDELNLAPTDILEALNRLLDDNRELFLPETQEVVRPHESFMLFATQNPPGLYGGRKVLSRAFRNRFLELHFNDIPENELEIILCQRSQLPSSWCSRIVEVYKELVILRQSERLFEQKNSFATLRDLFRWAFRKADNVEELAINGFMLLAERVRDPQEREDVRRIIQKVMKVALVDERIYDHQVIQQMGLRLGGPIEQNVVTTRSLVRVQLLVLKALENREPVLLVGETGCGKTTVCQMVAELLGTDIHILNAHQNTETGDIIGAQRPVRNKQHFEASLLESLQILARHLGTEYSAQTAELKDLLSLYDSLSEDDKQRLPTELRNNIEKDKERMDNLFEWHDGALVHAMKNKQHFLLDEISLADDAVLERLNSVLEPSRSLYLAETGSSDAQVVADQGFQFLATMNPGGDYGKKELSPALRNRFTEIWVPPPDDPEDLLNIAKNKLGPSLPNLAIPLLNFCHFFETKSSESQSFASLRQMLSWIEFLRLDEEAKPSSIVHGAAMVYIDALGANPSGKFGTPADTLIEERNASLDQLSSEFDIDAVAIYYASPELSLTDTALTIGPFSVQRRLVRDTTPSFSLDAPTTRRNALRIVRALQLRKSVLIEGEPGVGKTALVTALADLVGVNLTRINLSEQTDIMDLFGSDLPVDDGNVGQFQFREGPFLQAMQRGEWILLDEMNLASQSILEGLNACLDHRGQIYVAELDRVFTRHPCFRLFAAQNPFSQGGGRKGLPASFVNRFTVVYADELSEADMMTVSSRLHSQSSAATIQGTVKYLSKISKLAKPPSPLPSSGAPWEFNLRDLLRWLSLLNKDNSLLSGSRPQDLEGVLFHSRFRSEEDIERVTSLMETFSHQRPNFHVYTQIIQPHYLQCGFGFLERKPSVSSTMTRNHRHDPRVMETLFIAVEEKWPCLLVGSSGSGKSSIINDLAAMCGARVATMSMTTEMDTLDIVGGYEQVDQHRRCTQYISKVRAALEDLSVEKILSQKDLRNISEALMLSKTPRLDRNHFLEALEKCAMHSSHMSDLFSEGKDILQQGNVDSGVRFEWVNSVLVDTMGKNNHWLILDNANLCSSSVLDRLNGLLESSGVLTINEHRHADGSPHIVKQHNNFRMFLTMDPHHGELSRAMRNRCVEVYLPQRQHQPSQPPPTPHSSSLSRFQNFALFEWNSLSDDETLSLARVCFEYLSPSDFEISDEWWNQVRHGLLGVEQGKVDILQAAYEVIKGITAQHLSATSVNELYKLASSEIAKEVPPKIFASSQPLNPLNNPPLIAQLRNKGTFEKAMQASALLNCLQRAKILQIRLLRLSRPHGLNNTDFENRLTRSALSNQDKTFSRDSTKNLALFFYQVLETVISWMGELSLDDLELSSSACTITDWINDLFSASQEVPFNDGKFEQYIKIGGVLAGSLRSNLGSTAIHESLTRGLGLFDEEWKLTSAHGMARLWQLFRPRVPSTLRDLQQFLDLESITDQFDDLAWKTASSVQSILRIRTSLVSALRQLLEVTDVINKSGLLADTTALLQPILGDTFHITGVNELHGPFFSDEFECLRQYACSNAPSEQQNILDLFARRSVRHSVQRSSSFSGNYLLHQLRESTGIDIKDCELAALSGLLPLCIHRKVQNVRKVSLGSISRFQEELGIFQKQVATRTAIVNENHLLSLRKLLSDFLASVLEVHVEFFERDSLSAWIEALRGFQSDEILTHEMLERISDALKNKDEESAALQRIVNHNFSIATKYLVSRKDMSSINIALAFVSVFLGCLKLYVPNVPHDPALEPIVTLERWKNRKSRLERQLTALQIFEEKLTGMHTNLRCDLVRQQLAEMGQEPLAPPIVRPEIPQLLQLQETFNMASRVIIAPSEALLSSEHELRLEQAQIIRKSISRIVERLIGNYREYDDLIFPLVGLLRGLDVGLAMLLSPLNQSGMAGLSQREAEAPNVLGLHLRELQNSTQSQSAIRNFQSFDHRIASLRFAVLEQNIAGMDENLALRATGLLQSLYSEWKDQLEVARAREKAKSSLYRYRGDAQIPDDSKELEDLFPNMSNEPSAENDTISRKEPDPQALAELVADLHSGLFRTKTSEDIVITYLTNFTRSLVKARARMADLTVAQNISFLPSAVLQLSEASDRLSNGQAFRQSDFYHDSNLIEATKLVNLAFEIRRRFLGIQVTWPEHATPREVLEKIARLLELAHSEPLARILQRAESLHASINEWQQVASREFSVQSLYDQLTELLISWRRLELSSWSRLLNAEDRKQEQEASSWWFIIYEAVFPPFLESTGSRSQVLSYAETLLVEIQKFLRNSPMGQFEARIQLLATFSKHAQHLQRTRPAFSTAAECIEQMIRYASRWLPENQSRIKKGREKLDKKMKDILLLTSWKDTNISALRESARKSHQSLLKIVRAYRELLAQQVTTSPMTSENIDGAKTSSGTRLLDRQYSSNINEAVRVCEVTFPTWSSRAARLHNPSKTALLMSRLSEPPMRDLDTEMYLTSFHQNFAVSIRALQGETPSKLTIENKAQIKHLKARKRHLLADSIKDIRQMGIRQNLDATTLGAQSSLEKTLSNLPLAKPLINSEKHFYGFLDQLLTARQTSKIHSDDLTSSEVVRCTGLLEGLAYHLIGQRRSLGTTFADIEVCDKLLRNLHAIYQPEQYLISRKDAQETCFVQCQKRALWLKALINATKAVIERLETMGEHFPGVKAGLERRRDQLSSFHDSLELLPSIPPDLTSTSYAERQKNLDELCFILHEDIEQWSTQFPNTRFVLQHLKPWLRERVNIDSLSPLIDLSSTVAEHLKPASATRIQFDETRVFEVVDSMLVGIQKMKSIFEDLPSTTDESAWLTREEKVLNKATLSLRLPDFVSHLGDLLLYRLGSCEGEYLDAACALSAVVLQIVQQYRNSLCNVVAKRLSSHESLCRLALVLSQGYNEIATKGFCSPQEDSKEQGESSKTEEGVGLGEGEAAEDISKNIDNTDDLSELAQEPNQERRDGSQEEDRFNDEAIDLQDDDLEGQLDEEGTKPEVEAEDQGSDEEDAMSDEVGDVDELDPSAVDEKLWSGEAEDAVKEKEGAAKGQQRDELQAKDDRQTDDMEVADEDRNSVSNHEEDEDNEGQDQPRQDAEQLEQHVSEEDNLDLPDDMKMDGTDPQDVSSDDEEMQDLSDIEEEADKASLGSAEEELETPNEAQKLSDEDSLTNEDDDLETMTAPENASNNQGKEDMKDVQSTLEATGPDIESSEGPNFNGNLQLEVEDTQNEHPESKDDVQLNDEEETKNGSANDSKSYGDGEKQFSTTKQIADRSREQRGRDEKPRNLDQQPFRKLAEALEKWHRANQEIQNASEQEGRQAGELVQDAVPDSFSHLQNEGERPDTQALGAASNEEARALNQQEQQGELEQELPKATDELGEREDISMAEPESVDPATDTQDDNLPNSVVRNLKSQARFGTNDENVTVDASTETFVEEVDHEMSDVDITAPEEPVKPINEARSMWFSLEQATRDLSLSLTEQLRLILAPSQATKMRGDFRTGKRLNIKRIIPYIASQYKRDKIWMRRSIPSKRNYQVMVAVDDSKSMNEGGSSRLALESLALLSRSLSMLEVGQICIASFGESFQIAHPFEQQFSSESAIKMVQHFNFRQTETKVRNLLSASLDVFRQARARQARSGPDFQLQLIISDARGGIYDELDLTQRLIRQAYEERIMIVFAIVNASSEGSILDMLRAPSFGPDENGEINPRIKRYLDGFPFIYYLIVRDVKALPALLSTALRQWFAEVSEST